MDIEEALTKYRVQLVADGRSPHTLEQYERHVRLLHRWLVAEGHSDSLDTITHETLAAFLANDVTRHRPDGKPKRATTMNALRTSLRMFFDYAHRILAASGIGADGAGSSVGEVLATAAENYIVFYGVNCIRQGEGLFIG